MTENAFPKNYRLDQVPTSENHGSGLTARITSSFVLTARKQDGRIYKKDGCLFVTCDKDCRCDAHCGNHCSCDSDRTCTDCWTNY